MTKSEVPGKILVASLWFLAHDVGGSVRVRKKGSKRLLSTVESVFEGCSRKRRKMNQVRFEGGIYRGVELKDDDFVFQLSVKRPGAKEPEEQKRVDAKATKDDNAKVPEHLWNDKIAEKLMLTWKRTRRKELDGVRKHSRNMTQHFKPPLIFKRAVNRLRFRWVLKRIQKACLHYWRKKVQLDFQKWYRKIGCHHDDADQVLADEDAAVERAQARSFLVGLGQRLFNFLLEMAS